MALVTSCSEGSSVEAEASAVTEADSVSSEAELVPASVAAKLAGVRADSSF